MMSIIFLKQFGISEQTIDEIKEKNNDSLLYTFISDEKNACRLILFFQEIGIEVIKELLIYRLDIFSIDIDKMRAAFEQYNQSVVVQLINEDIHAINLL